MSSTGPWSSAIRVFGTSAFIQQDQVGCVAACCEILSDGAILQRDALARIGAPATPAQAEVILAEVTGTRWRSGYFGSGEDAVTIARRGRMAAMLQAPGGKLAHMVVLVPKAGAFTVQDPGNGVIGTVDAQWVQTYVVGGAWQAT